MWARIALSLTITMAAVAQDAEWRSLMPVWGEGGPAQTGPRSERYGGAWSFKEPAPGATRAAEIIGVAPAGQMGWWRVPGEYWDFELELEFLTPAPANGGVLVRGHRLPLMSDTSQMVMYGYQVNIETRANDATGAIIDENRRGRIIGPGEDAQALVKPREWNAMTIQAAGPIIEVRINGAIACRLYDEAYLGGLIAFQVAPFDDGQAEVRYRNIRIRDLGRTGEWRSIFNGATLLGWQEWGDEEWRVENGTIQGRRGPKQSEGYLATVETWKDFHVRAEFRMLGDGNYGLFYHSTIRLREDGYPVISGVQGEVMPGRPAETGRLYESYRRGWITPRNREDVGAWALREGEWNTIDIRNKGNHVTTWVNGIRVVDFFDLTPQLFEGTFALQLHTGEGAGIDWRNLYVKED